MNIQTRDNRLKILRRKINNRFSRSIEQQLSKNTSFTHLTDDELRFAHTMTHFIHSRGSRSTWSYEDLLKCHEKLVTEIEGRNMTHHLVDKMDRSIEQKLEVKQGEEWEWSQSYIDTLPDEAFAYIRLGGSLDSEGKTLPRILRLFPHHTSDVVDPEETRSIDLDHLKKAIKQLQLALISDEEKDIVISHLEKHLDDSIYIRKKEEERIWKETVEEAKPNMIVNISNQIVSKEPEFNEQSLDGEKNED